MWKDASQREWSTAITVTTVKRVQELAGVLLTDMDAILRVDNDIMLLCDVLSAITQPQRDERGVTSQQFGELLFGVTLDAAYESFRQDLLDFFPPSRRKVVQQIFQTTQKIQVEQCRLLETKLTDEQFRKLVNQQLEKLGNESGKSPASSALTPGD
jgi:hypothetical protein